MEATNIKFVSMTWLTPEFSAALAKLWHWKTFDQVSKMAKLQGWADMNPSGIVEDVMRIAKKLPDY